MRSNFAVATKQSRVPPRKDSGLLRCARHDGVRGSLFPLTAQSQTHARSLAAHVARVLLPSCSPSKQRAQGRPHRR
ncbi:hypothetical protein EAV90_38215 [Bradyrhizobium vignae]|nr:hypothetical protein EAV90_38215 [Bradyrhizobium vignae]